MAPTRGVWLLSNQHVLGALGVLRPLDYQSKRASVALIRFLINDKRCCEENHRARGSSAAKSSFRSASERELEDRDLKKSFRF